MFDYKKWQKKFATEFYSLWEREYREPATMPWGEPWLNDRDYPYEGDPAVEARKHFRATKSYLQKLHKELGY